MTLLDFSNPTIALKKYTISQDLQTVSCTKEKDHYLLYIHILNAYFSLKFFVLCFQFCI